MNIDADSLSKSYWLGQVNVRMINRVHPSLKLTIELKEYYIMTKNGLCFRTSTSVTD